jgi:DNA-binding transcriptional ArsR family regulator
MKTKSAVAALGALAQETRLDAFRALVEAGPAGIAAGDLARRLGVPPPTLSFHLRDLSAAGLTSFVREGRSIRYIADFEAMTALMSFLTDNCCGGRPEICAPVACTPASVKPISKGETA